ncbi:MAG: hypothetical protein GY817_05695 [bacterium]|nr:hypothetical protein [bacterium]
MDNKDLIFDEVDNLYKIILLKPFRKTTGVSFDIIPIEQIPKIDGIDRICHVKGAQSPRAVDSYTHPWYKHKYQEDYLLVLQGIRYTDIYTPAHGKIESFEITPDYIKKNNKIICDASAMLVWPCNVFHRIRTDDEGSLSINLAARHERFSIQHNFDIYDLDVETGKYRVIREGYLDQS